MTWFEKFCLFVFLWTVMCLLVGVLGALDPPDNEWSRIILLAISWVATMKVSNWIYRRANGK